MTALQNTSPSADEIEHAEKFVRELLKDQMGLLRLSREEWKEAVRLANLVPKPRWNRKLVNDLTDARQTAKRQAAIENISPSDMVHVGVYGTYDQALVRKVDKIALRPWLAVPRLYQLQPVRLAFDGKGDPNGEVRRSDENFTHYIGIPPSRSSEITTAIMCSKTDAALLKMEDMVGWWANLVPEMEDYFRRTATFDWEAGK